MTNLAGWLRFWGVRFWDVLLGILEVFRRKSLDNPEILNQPSYIEQTLHLK
ncbi:MAG: hypothetical protein AB1589_05770 [Cyanobacteriota bacterium]